MAKEYNQSNGFQTYINGSSGPINHNSLPGLDHSYYGKYENTLDQVKYIAIIGQIKALYRVMKQKKPNKKLIKDIQDDIGITFKFASEHELKSIISNFKNYDTSKIEKINSKKLYDFVLAFLEKGLLKKEFINKIKESKVEKYLDRENDIWDISSNPHKHWNDLDNWEPKIEPPGLNDYQITYTDDTDTTFIDSNSNDTF